MCVCVCAGLNPEAEVLLSSVFPLALQSERRLAKRSSGGAAPAHQISLYGTQITS